jgi:DNA primase small subunit
MNFRTKQFLRSRFQHYYNTHDLLPPPDFGRREWGFILFDELPEVRMRRHKSFGTGGELVEYIRGMVPAHVYYSAAYYSYPAAQSMQEKEWKGADLIFDLDADHLKNRGSSYEEMLENVKRETLKLLDFLMEDFGIASEQLEVVFSGGRGYHIHVRDPRMFLLESGARREIVDYLTGTGFDQKMVFKSDSNWSVRVSEKIVDYFCKLRFSMDREEAVRELRRWSRARKETLMRLMDSLYRRETPEELEEDIRAQGLEQWKFTKKIAEDIVNELGISALRGETDEPVTTDVKRLIRLPTSLHGGSGFIVTPLNVSELESFNPLIDAVAFGVEPVEVVGLKPFEIQMCGDTYTVEIGRQTLPECVAVYAMCRGVCEYG